MLTRLHFSSVNFDQESVRQCFLNWPWDDPADENDALPKAGTKKRMRKHAKVVKLQILTAFLS